MCGPPVMLEPVSAVIRASASVLRASVFRPLVFTLTVCPSSAGPYVRRLRRVCQSCRACAGCGVCVSRAVPCVCRLCLACVGCGVCVNRAVPCVCRLWCVRRPCRAVCRPFRACVRGVVRVSTVPCRACVGRAMRVSAVPCVCRPCSAVRVSAVSCVYRPCVGRDACRLWCVCWPCRAVCRSYRAVSCVCQLVYVYGVIRQCRSCVCRSCVCRSCTVPWIREYQHTLLTASSAELGHDEVGINDGTCT